MTLQRLPSPAMGTRYARPRTLTGWQQGERAIHVPTARAPTVVHRGPVSCQGIIRMPPGFWDTEAQDRILGTV